LCAPPAGEQDGAYVYVIGVVGHQAVKIGYAADPRKRLGDLQVGCPFPLVLLDIFPTDNAREIEAALHSRFSAERMQGEWFDLGADGRLVARRAYRELASTITSGPERNTMTGDEQAFLTDIYPWVMALPKFARHVTVEHLAGQLEATGHPRWDRVGLVTVGRILDRLFERAFHTPARNYSIGHIRVAVIRKAARYQATVGVQGNPYVAEYVRLPLEVETTSPLTV
jgi:hypothetical protein